MNLGIFIRRPVLSTAKLAALICSWLASVVNLPVRQYPQIPSSLPIRRCGTDLIQGSSPH